MYEDIKKMVVLILRKIETPTYEEIKKHINAVIGMQRTLGKLVNIDEVALFRDIQSHVSTWQAEPMVLRDKKHINWLPDRKAEIQWNFWKRYRQYLEEEKNWPTSVTTKLDKVTDATLGDIGNPAQSGQWDRRGMVVGEVQSGKTANYTGLICKAVDSGYKLVIVLAGMTNDLRSQTQSRLDYEFLGFESEVGRTQNGGSRIGVGKLESPRQLIVHPLTYSSRDGDFRANNSANLQLGGSPILLVVKKNTSVLKRILAWAQGQGRIHSETGKRIIDNIPLLLLDDEADNASVNTKKIDEDPTQINKVIRQILNTFRQKSYVGYTATPFANIFIPPDEEENLDFGDDLFPKGFIYYIPPPSNYIGAAQVFGLNEDLDGEGVVTEGLPLVRAVQDAVNIFPLSHNKELKVDELPLSLIRALQSFIITCAARRARKQIEVHNSMLVHVTRFNDVQSQVMDLIGEELVNMHRMLEFGTGGQATKFLAQLEEIWNVDYLPTFKAVTGLHKDPQIIELQWEDVRKELLNAVSRIVVRGINGDAGGVLDYFNHPNGLNVIAVGGDKLSRGLTLEGLSISYYIRPAKNYDTLLQMGRWFGYRPGYVDLCRLFTTDDLIGWYEHIAVANEELRREFVFMELMKQTPEDYGLKVRTHPGGLAITAANKIRHGRKMRVSFSGYLAQTTIFNKESKINEENFEKLQKWLAALPTTYSTEKTRIAWKNIPASQVVHFLENFQTHPACRKAEGDLLIRYIEKLVSFGELVNWEISLISNSEPTAKRFKIAEHEVGLLKRSECEKTNTELYMLKNSNILSPSDEQQGLEPEEIARALAENIADYNNGVLRSKNKPTKPSGPYIRKVRPPQKGLLLIYPLDHTHFDKPFTSKPIIGFAISFPKSTRGEESAIEYQVNTRYWRDRYGEEDDDEA